MKLQKTKAPDDPRLGLMLGAWRELTETLANLDEQRAGFAGQLRDLEEQQLPALMDELGVEKLTSALGETVELKDVLTASVADRNHVKAETILKRIGAEDIIRTEVNFSFSNEEADQMNALFAWSKQAQVPETHKIAINTGTLKAVVARSLEAGDLQPADLEPLGVYRVQKVKVKLPKNF